MTLKGRIVGLCAGLTALICGAAGAIAASLKAHTGRAGTIEHAINVTLNDERAAAGVARLHASHVLHMIAEHRARVARQRGRAYPGYDVSSDLRHFHVCFRGAREWEFAFTTTDPGRAARVMRRFAVELPGYRTDLLRRSWHDFATGVAVTGNTTYLIEDFAALC